MQKLKTFFLNFRTLKREFMDRLTQLTSERLISKKILQFVVDKNILTAKSNPDLLEKYKKICEK